MKHQVLFSLKNSEKIFMNVVCYVVIGALRVKQLLPCFLSLFEAKFILFHSDPDDPFKLTEDTRNLGLVVCRGTSVVLICPAEGMESIPNPFIQQDG